MKEENNELVLEKVEMNDIISFYNNIDGVSICVDDGRLEKIASPNMSGLHMKIWKNGRGGVLEKDIRSYLKGSCASEYFILSGDETKILVRIIKEEEHEYFRVRGLINGKIKDASYVTIRDFNQTPQKNHEYIEQVQLDITDEEEDEFNEDFDIPLEDEASFNHNVSLFED